MIDPNVADKMQRMVKVMFIGTVALTLATLVGYVHHHSHRVRFHIVDRLVAIVDGGAAPFKTITNETSLTSLAIDDDDGDEEDDQGSSITNGTTSEADVLEESPSAGGYALNSGGPCIRQFIASYNKFCSQWLRPRPENVPARWQQRLNMSASSVNVDENALCQCVPRQLRK